MGRIDKRVIAGAALVVGILTVIVVVVASSGGGDGGSSAALSEQAPQGDAPAGSGEGAGGRDGGDGAGGAPGSGGAAAGGQDGDGGSGGGGDGGSGGSRGGSGGGDGGAGGQGSPGGGGGSGGDGSAPGSDAAPGAGGGPGSAAEQPLVELTVRDNRVVGGFKRLSYTRDERVRLRVRADVSDIVRVDGYNLSRKVDPGEAAEFEFDAKVNGVFEVSLQKRGLALAFLIVKGDIDKRQ